MNYKMKLAWGSLLAFLLIVGSIMTALSILKDEAVDNYITISKLNAKSFSKELNQDIYNIEQTIKNIAPLFNVYSSQLNINKRLQDMQRSYAQIRSINILRNDTIVYSSNEKNINLSIQTQHFFPNPIFEDNILKVGVPWIGRDFVDAQDLSTYKNDIVESDSFFIPISKKIETAQEELNVIVNLNSDYFSNRFLNNINADNITFELLRVDGLLLLSTNSSNHLGKAIQESKLQQQTIEKNEVTGMEMIDGKKHIVTYIMTDNYPITLAVKMDYEKSLLGWNKRQYDFFVITTVIIIVSILLALFFFYLYNKKRVEEIALQQLQLQDQKKFKLLFQDSHFMAVILSKNGEILDINHKALHFLNQKDTQVKKKKLWQLKCWDKEVSYTLERMIAQFKNERVEDELMAINGEGEESIIEFSLSSLKVENETILLAIGLDITKRKQRDAKLKQAYTVFNNTRDGIMITDKYTRLLDVNIAFENITGYQREEILNKRTRFLKSNLHDEAFYKKMWDSILNQGYWAGEIINLNKNKEQFTEWLTINAIYDQEGEVVNYIAVFSDITEQKAKEQMLRQKDEVLYQQSKMAAMGEMIGNIAHQWRQPLSVISSGATSIIFQKEQGISSEEDEKTILYSMNKSAQYLSKTIDDFRNFLKEDKAFRYFKVEEAMEDAIALSSINGKANEVEVICNFEELEVYGVKNEFIQVLINILNNAQDALACIKDEQKYVFIDTFSKEDSVFVTIKDSGGGIPEEIISRIFEPYFTTKHKSQGTGIGLYMSEEIIRKQMNGALTAHNTSYSFNENEYMGACLTIKLSYDN